MRRYFYAAVAAAVASLALVAGALAGPGSGTSTPYAITFSGAGQTWTCTGIRFVNRDIIQDGERCLISGDTTGIFAGTFSGSPYGAFFSRPNSRWASDYDQQIATQWTMTVTDNGNGTFTAQILAFYGDQSPTPGNGVATPYTITFGPPLYPGPTWSCWGSRVVNGNGVKDSETCVLSGDTSGVAAGTFSGDPYGDLFGTPQVRWASSFDVQMATRWTITVTDNGDGTFTAAIVAFYS